MVSRSFQFARPRATCLEAIKPGTHLCWWCLLRSALVHPAVLAALARVGASNTSELQCNRPLKNAAWNEERRTKNQELRTKPGTHLCWWCLLPSAPVQPAVLAALARAGASNTSELQCSAGIRLNADRFSCGFLRGTVRQPVQARSRCSAPTMKPALSLKWDGFSRRGIVIRRYRWPHLDAAIYVSHSS